MNKESGLAKKGIDNCKKHVQKRWKQGEMLQSRNTETLSRQARMILGELKLNYSRDWQETWQQVLLLLRDKNKQGKRGLTAD